MNSPTASVLVPACDEQGIVAATVGAAMAVPEVIQVVVVDDRSSDRTAEVAAEAGAEVVRLPRRRGKGGALNAGLDCLTEPYVLLLDADLGTTAGEARKLLGPVMSGRCDMTIARFHMPGARRGFGLVSRLARWAAAHYGRGRIENPLCGQRALSRDLLLAVSPLARGFGVDTAMVIDVLRLGLRVEEVPVDMSHRRGGWGPGDVLHRALQFFDVASIILAYALRRRPPLK